MLKVISMKQCLNEALLAPFEFYSDSIIVYPFTVFSCGLEIIVKLVDLGIETIYPYEIIGN
jgi:hypothetical protein